MPTDSARERALTETRDRILEVALDVLGRRPDAGMGDIASAAGVVRRTVYGHFPARSDLVRSLTERAVTEVLAVVAEVDAPGRAPEAVWVDVIARLWPLAHRYRVLVALRRGEFGEEIHALLAPVDNALAGLVRRGQATGSFGDHLPAETLSQIAFGAVFTIAGDAHAGPDAQAAIMTTLLLLGVPRSRAKAIATKRAGTQPLL